MKRILQKHYFDNKTIQIESGFEPLSDYLRVNLTGRLSTKEVNPLLFM